MKYVVGMFISAISLTLYSLILFTAWGVGYNEGLDDGLYKITHNKELSDIIRYNKYQYQIKIDYNIQGVK